MTMSSAAARPALSVMLIVSDADAAMRWYTTALGAGRLWDLGGVAGLDLGGAPFFVHEAVPGKNREPSPTAVGLTTTRIEVFIDEPDELIERLHKLARPTWNRSARTTRRGGGTVREALPIHLVIVGQWATGPHCNGFPGRRRSEPASGGRAAVVIIASAGVGSDGERLSAGVWTPSDIAWVPSLQNADPPHRWCSLTAGATCSSRRSTLPFWPPLPRRST